MLNSKETETLSTQSEGGKVNKEVIICLQCWPSHSEGPEYTQEMLAGHIASLCPRESEARGHRDEALLSSPTRRGIPQPSCEQWLRVPSCTCRTS